MRTRFASSHAALSAPVPNEGFREGETFYAARLDLPRRLFVGALPSRADTAQFGIRQRHGGARNSIVYRALPPQECMDELGLRVHTVDEVADLLFRYELELLYANRKTRAPSEPPISSAGSATEDPHTSKLSSSPATRP